MLPIKEKIIETIHFIADALNRLDSECYIIGASAMILSDVAIEYTNDIDLLTDSNGSQQLQALLSEYRIKEPITKEDSLFRSHFAAFALPLLELEVMGNLQVMKNNRWNNVEVNEFVELQLDNLHIKIPTLEEQKRILLLFGREKDLQRVKLIDQKLSRQ